MQINAGTVIIVLVLAACAVVAVFVTVKTYLWSRQDHTGRSEDSRGENQKKDGDAKSPPSI